MYLFSKKIKCLRCEGYFRGITERKKKKYYCSTYHNERSCIRHVVTEAELVDLIYNHVEIRFIQNMIGLGKISKGESREEIIQKINPSVFTSYVKEIGVDPSTKTIEIIYSDGTFTKITESRQIY